MICEVRGQLAWLASDMDFRFLAPVYFGDTITCRITITEIDQKGRAKAALINQEGRQVAAAALTGRLPMGRDRERLRQMMAQVDPTNPLT